MNTMTESFAMMITANVLVQNTKGMSNSSTNKKVFEANYSSKNSMLYWYPLVKELELTIPMPMTIIVDKIGCELFDFVLREKRLPKTTIARIKGAITAVGGYPVFMRSDYGSAKHDYEETCYVPDEKSLLQHIYNLLEWHHMVDIGYNALVFREFIELESPFKAFHGLPINRERRYFVRDGQIQCRHAYWVEDAIYRPSDPMWQRKLGDLNTQTDDEVNFLTTYAVLLASKLQGYWSVDFVKAKDGRWYFMDAALGDASWHDKTCKFSDNNSD